MKKNFWIELPRPFFVLAPMANVTDAAFRRIVAKYGKPHVFYTEFVSADGLCSPGRKILLNDLKFSKAEHPIVAQFFTSKPANMEKVAKLAVDLGFDGIDINMGCPDRSIEKQGAGAALIRNPELARELIQATKVGAEGLPVSVKTRIGFMKAELQSWLPVLLEEKPAAIVIHARTRKELSLVPARWSYVKQAVEMAKGTGVLIIGNGDVADLNDARAKAGASGADGIMIGRAVFGNPWLFADRNREATIEEKLNTMAEHTKIFEKLLGGVKSFAFMKKHFKAYVNGFDGAKELRTKLMETKNAQEVQKIVDDFISKIIK